MANICPWVWGNYGVFYNFALIIVGVAFAGRDDCVGSHDRRKKLCL